MEFFGAYVVSPGLVQILFLYFCFSRSSGFSIIFFVFTRGRFSLYSVIRIIFGICLLEGRFKLMGFLRILNLASWLFIGSFFLVYFFSLFSITGSGFKLFFKFFGVGSFSGGFFWIFTGGFFQWMVGFFCLWLAYLVWYTVIKFLYTYSYGCLFFYIEWFTCFFVGFFWLAYGQSFKNFLCGWVILGLRFLHFFIYFVLVFCSRGVEDVYIMGCGEAFFPCSYPIVKKTSYKPIKNSLSKVLFFSPKN